MQKYLVGPVFSRRLGKSLGVDLLRGQCTFLCPYCEVRVHHVDKLQLFEFRHTDALYEQYAEFCRAHRRGDLDSVTFSGTGEPTLISNLGEILRKFRGIGPYPLTVITNGSLLWNPLVRRNLREADLVVPSLDAATESAWRRVNRPHRDVTLKKYLDGTERFCAKYPGRIWMEVLIVRGVNDKKADIECLGRFLKRLRLDRVQLGTVDRPPARSRVMPLSPSGLLQIARVIRNLSGQRVEVMARKSTPASSPAPPPPFAELPEKILQSVRLRPQTAEELRRALAVPRVNLSLALRRLRDAGKILPKKMGRRLFLQAAQES